MAILDNTSLRAASLIVFCMMTIAFSDNLLPLISKDFGLWEFHAYRSLMACSLFLIIGLFLKWSFRPKNFLAVIIRSLLFGTGMMFYFAALGVVPVAQAGAGLFTSPMFVLLFSVIGFRVPIGFWRIFAVILGFAGVLLVLQPNQDTFSWFSLLPVFGGAIYALGLMTTRHLCADEAATALVFWFLVTAGIYGVLGASYFHWVSPVDLENISYLSRGWTNPTPLFLWVTLFMGLITMIAVTAQARGYQMADASYLAVFEYSFLVSAAFWGWILWNQSLDALSVLGMVAIAISGTVIALRTRGV
jgi:drug/metabolite transporter (DMT)-like permease